ncbi:hypothetical protein, partial [Klebsiella aerogenes]|uniref:hypothetical protein n=1 Tax=Klebsiella aerogenes TaxID=548 RepID=UPI001BCA7F4D
VEEPQKMPIAFITALRRLFAAHSSIKSVSVSPANPGRKMQRSRTLLKKYPLSSVKYGRYG